MKLFYALFILAQLSLALLARDGNRVAYLKNLWSIHMGSAAPARAGKARPFFNSHYQETKSEVTTHEYSILLER